MDADKDREAPTEPDGGDAAAATHKRVFLTANLWKGDFGGVAGAHQKCQQAATKAGLDGDWVAWVSGNGKKAIDELTFDGPYELLDGTRIAASKQELLEKKLVANIRVMENGQTSTDGLRGVWTGTRTDGEIGETCSDWTTASGSVVGTVGDPKKDAPWTDTEGATVVGYGTSEGWWCSLEGRFYCFER